MVISSRLEIFGKDFIEGTTVTRDTLVGITFGFIQS